jgi:3-oxoacyl-[acyl-carrier protein] reductase
MLNSCEGKSVIVTGASKGIGKGIAAVFARHGAKVLVVARNLDQADACAAELRVGGRQRKWRALQLSVTAASTSSAQTPGYFLSRN